MLTTIMECSVYKQGRPNFFRGGSPKKVKTTRGSPGGGVKAMKQLLYIIHFERILPTDISYKFNGK